jgi:UDP-3-O-[3-hydroxymyristoyl] glucosamine N-acyltransferase
MTVTKQKILEFIKENNLILLQEGNLPVNFEFIGPAAYFIAKRENFTFLGKKLISAIDNEMSRCSAGLIILDEELKIDYSTFSEEPIILLNKEPKRVLISLCNEFFLSRLVPQVDISAKISEKAIIGKNNYIGANVYIDDGVVIGDDCIIEPNVVIKKNTIIGNRVIIKSNSVIGGDGFGYEKNINGMYEKFPHFGRVILEDDVHIGSNTCIDRGSLSDTIIKRGVKIDNLVHIAHNVELGENTIVIANSLVAGSVITGKNCWLAPSSTIRDGLRLGNNVTVGMGSVVVKSVQDDQTILGVPAKPIKK